MKRSHTSPWPPFWQYSSEALSSRNSGVKYFDFDRNICFSHLHIYLVTICPPEAGLTLKVFCISRNTYKRKRKEEQSKRKRQGRKRRGTPEHPNNNSRRNIQQKDIPKKTKPAGKASEKKMRKQRRDESKLEHLDPHANTAS